MRRARTVRVVVEAADEQTARSIHLLADVVNHMVLLQSPKLHVRRIATYGACNKRLPADITSAEERYVTCRRCRRIIQSARSRQG